MGVYLSSLKIDTLFRDSARPRSCRLSATLYSPLEPKPMYEANNAQAFWDVPLFAEHQEVTVTRADARIINHESKQVITLSMCCPWVTNREERKEAKTTKYGPLRSELKQKY